MRNNSIDSIKGLCILHMLLLHITIIYGKMNFVGVGASTIYYLLNFFMVPFFFFSGYFFSNKKNMSEYVQHKFKKLMVPWLFWSLLSLPVYYIYQYYKEGCINVLEPFKMFIQIGSLSSNDALWFLFSLFIVNVIFYILRKMIASDKLLLMVTCCCFLYAYLDSVKLPCILSSSNISLGLVYFSLGYFTRKYIPVSKLFRLKYLAIAVVIFTLIYICDPQYMMLVTLMQAKGNFINNLLYSLAGVYILWFVFSKFNLGFLSYMGRHSMTVYVWHMIPLRLVFDPILKFYFPNIQYIPYMLLTGGVILISSHFIEKSLNTCAPPLLGK